MDEREDNKNPQDTRRVPIVRDGVGYTPSGADDFDYDYDYDFDPDAVGATMSAPPDFENSDDIGQTRKISTAAARDSIARATKNPPRTQPKPGPQKKRYAPKKAHYAILLVTTVFVSVILVVFVFAMMFNEWNLGDGIGNQNNQTAQNGVAPPPVEPEEPVEQEPLDLAPGNLSVIGLVQEINMITGGMDLYIMEDSLMRWFFVENHSTLRDKFGNTISFTDFNIGDVVEIVHMEDSTAIETARVSAQVRTFRNVRDVVVNTETNQLMIGNERFHFNQHTVVMYHGEPDDIEDISTVDIVTVNTFPDRNGVHHVVFVDIHQGNGIIHIPENDMILQGTVEVANTTFAGLEGEMEIRVPEGSHRVTIRGINIEIFEYELTVTRGGSASVSLDGLELLSGSLTVNVEDPYVNLTIDGAVQLTNSMIMLDYGTYTVSVTRDGFTPFMQEVTIDSANHEITVVLEEIIRTQNVTLTTSPPGARMYVDGQYVGLSPVSIELELRRHSVTMALEGFVGGATDIWVTEDQPIFSWWLQQDPNFQATPTPWPTPTPQTYQPTPTPEPEETPPPALYPEVSPSPSPTPFFR